MNNEKLPVVEDIVEIDPHAALDAFAELTNGKEDEEDE